jgi:hypothetical protein
MTALEEVMEPSMRPSTSSAMAVAPVETRAI